MNDQTRYRASRNETSQIVKTMIHYMKTVQEQQKRDQVQDRRRGFLFQGLLQCLQHFHREMVHACGAHIQASESIQAENLLSLRHS